MKSKTLFILLFLTLTSFNSTSDFSDGFEEGHCEGWKYEKGQLSVCPVAPVCPVPDIDQNNYKGGYNKGFEKGREDARE